MHYDATDASKCFSPFTSCVPADLQQHTEASVYSLHLTVQRECPPVALSVIPAHLAPTSSSRDEVQGGHRADTVQRECSHSTLNDSHLFEKSLSSSQPTRLAPATSSRDEVQGGHWVDTVQLECSHSTRSDSSFIQGITAQQPTCSSGPCNQ